MMESMQVFLHRGRADDAVELVAHPVVQHAHAAGEFRTAPGWRGRLISSSERMALKMSSSKERLADRREPSSVRSGVSSRSVTSAARTTRAALQRVGHGQKGLGGEGRAHTRALERLAHVGEPRHGIGAVVGQHGGGLLGLGLTAANLVRVARRRQLAAALAAHVGHGQRRHHVTDFREFQHPKIAFVHIFIPLHGNSARSSCPFFRWRSIRAACGDPRPAPRPCRAAGESSARPRRR